ncbi:hypothetical protein IQ07DRAFT_439498 [Pyrenochaeta sp. DS3sAY3a]|nr:hypothetical protein IQ07DRAFT_439498 [Pyrenochaeta sp. DS3sAY3a]
MTWRWKRKWKWTLTFICGIPLFQFILLPMILQAIFILYHITCMDKVSLRDYYVSVRNWVNGHQYPEAFPLSGSRNTLSGV